MHDFTVLTNEVILRRRLFFGHEKVLVVSVARAIFFQGISLLNLKDSVDQSMVFKHFLSLKKLLVLMPVT